MRIGRGTGKAASNAFDAVLGARARWGRVGYTGRAFAPAPETYGAAGDATRLALTTRNDSGRCPGRGPEIANLYPLIAAALYEAGFASEAGALSTWRN